MFVSSEKTTDKISDKHSDIVTKSGRSEEHYKS